MRRIILFSIAILLLSAAGAYAQRTAYQEYQVTARGQLSNNSIGAEVSFGSYLVDGYWAGGISAVNRAAIENLSREVVSFPRVEVFGQLMWAPYRNRSRELNTYVGGDLFVGWELMDPLKSSPDHIRQSLKNAGYDTSRFIYGAALRAEVEWFVSDRFALLAAVRTPAAFRSKLRVFGWEAGIGIRQNF